MITEERIISILNKLDQEASEDDDEETPPEYSEGVFSTTNSIRRELGIPLPK